MLERVKQTRREREFERESEKVKKPKRRMGWKQRGAGVVRRREESDLYFKCE